MNNKLSFHKISSFPKCLLSSELQLLDCFPPIWPDPRPCHKPQAGLLHPKPCPGPQPFPHHQPCHDPPTLSHPKPYFRPKPCTLRALVRPCRFAPKILFAIHQSWLREPTAKLPLLSSTNTRRNFLKLNFSTLEYTWIWMRVLPSFCLHYHYTMSISVECYTNQNLYVLFALLMQLNYL